MLVLVISFIHAIKTNTIAIYNDVDHCKSYEITRLPFLDVSAGCGGQGREHLKIGGIERVEDLVPGVRGFRAFAGIAGFGPYDLF